MVDKIDAAGKNDQIVKADMQPAELNRVPQYRRDLFPTNVVLSAEDLAALYDMLIDVHERAKNIEFNNLDKSKFESADHARSRLNELVQLEYSYVGANGDSVRGVTVPRVDDRNFPEELSTFFVSNASFSRRTINQEPLNVVDIFLSFTKPSLKLDFNTLPSNPTENRSVINVFGRDEDWVISTTNRLQEFFRHKKAFRPVIHASGAYDYLIYLVYLPVVFWILLRKDGFAETWFATRSLLTNITLGIYLLLLSLLFARFIFQYLRWLFPPMEYYKKSRVGAFTHRAIAGALGAAILLGASYDIAKGLFIALFN